MRFNEIKQNTPAMLNMIRKHSTGPVTLSNNMINIDGDYRLETNTTKLPVKFGKVIGEFHIDENLLKTLEGCPYYVGGDIFNCGFNHLKSLIGGPIKVMGDYIARGNPLISLDGLPKELNGAIHLEYDEHLPMLKLFFVKNLTGIIIYTSDNAYRDKTMQLEAILSKYVGKGPGGALACGAELIKAGFKGNARK